MDNVEKLCKTLPKTLCNFCELFCGFFYEAYKKCEQLQFPTIFSFIIHPLFHYITSPITNQRFTHLHSPYYNYYK